MSDRGALGDWDDLINIGHRGARALEPENTLRGFTRAYDEGADGIELDVRRSRDGVLMVIHDDDLDRVTGGVYTGKVSDYTLEELQRMDVGDGEYVPTLEETLELVVDRKGLVNVEIKDSGIARDVVETVNRYGLGSSTLISSFDYLEVWEAKRADPAIRTALLVPGANPLSIYSALLAGADAINPAYSTLNDAFVNAAHAAGLKVYTYTVNEGPDMQRLVDIGVDGIITDRPDLLYDVLHGW